MKKKITSIVSIMIVVITIFGSMSLIANAATTYKYPKVDLKVPFCSQFDDDGCGIASVTMVELYTQGYRGRKDDWRKTISYDMQEKAYKTVKKFNCNSVCFSSPKKLGYTTSAKLDYNKIYKEIKSGRPVILYFKGSKYGPHFVVAYCVKNTNKIKDSDILIYSPNAVRYVKQYKYNSKTKQVTGNAPSFGSTTLAKFKKDFPTFLWAAYKTSNKQILKSNFVETPQLKTAPVDGGLAVTLTSKTKGATVYYTLDGSKPTADSATFDGTPIIVTESTTIKAQAGKKGMSASKVLTQELKLSRTSTPDISYKFTSSGPQVTITPASADAAIYYTVDGTDPDMTSARYASPFTAEPVKVTEDVLNNNSVTCEFTIKAIAVEKGKQVSEVATLRLMTSPRYVDASSKLPVGITVTEL